MMQLKDQVLWLLLVSVVTFNVYCDEKSDDDLNIKTRRGASIGTYSYVSSDALKHGHSHVKILSVLKNLEYHTGAIDGSSFAPFQGSNKPSMVKTTVEYWPPDMDKRKFYDMKKDSSIDMWPQYVEKEVKVIVKKKPVQPVVQLPDIPIGVHTWSLKAPIAINDFEPLIEPTEAVVADDVAITNAGPVVFPTNAPTIRSPEQSIAFVARGSNKKRKLKKKVKPAPIAPFVEITQIPFSNSVIENQNNEAKPIHEVIDEPFIGQTFEPKRYTEVVNTLSNLTEQTFGSNRGSDSNLFEVDKSPQLIEIQIGDITPQTTRDAFGIKNSSEHSVMSQDFGMMKATTEPSLPTVPISIKDLMPLERMLNQLKRAIDERNIAKIKRIVKLLEEPKPETTSATTTAVPSTTQSIITNMKEVPSTTSASETTTKLPLIVLPTTVRDKIYLAPRVRLAQKKNKPVKAKSSDDQQKDNSATSTIRQSIRSATEIVSTSLLSVASSTMPAIKNRAHRSHITPRVRKMATKSRNTARNISRRIARKPV